MHRRRLGNHPYPPAGRRESVLDWIGGTALLPVRERLNEQEYQQFCEELIPPLTDACPPRHDGTTFFPFRRVFAVAQVGR